MLGQSQQRSSQFGVAREPLGTVHQPQVQLVIQHPRLTHQLGMVTLGIVHQIAGVYLEELRQHLAGGVGQVGPRTAFDLR